MKDIEKTMVGASEYVSIGRRAIDVPAKIDTGADSSAIWASKVRVGRDGVLRFALFGEGSEFYSGKIFKRTDFEVAVVRSAMGEEQVRYRTRLLVKIGGRKIRVLFSLADRSKNNFPILIGKRTLARRFIVDVTQNVVEYPRNPRTPGLAKEFAKNPYAFDQKYGMNKKSNEEKS
ncbi:RimK/LysX family protein [Candidatus Saccharibacteria bacterium]|nr:RimK/LysX family protein [Candidatus Saccharibacteria bacterium]